MPEDYWILQTCTVSIGTEQQGLAGFINDNDLENDVRHCSYLSRTLSFYLPLIRSILISSTDLTSFQTGRSRP